MMEANVGTMKLEFDPQEIDQLLDFILEECPEIIFNVLKQETCKPRKKKKKLKEKKREVFDKASRCASVEVLTRNTFYNSFSLPRNNYKSSFNVPSFSSFHRIPSNINVSISFENKCLFDHQLKNRSLENLSKCTCVLNNFNDYKIPSKVHFSRPLIFNCNKATENNIKEAGEPLKVETKEIAINNQVLETSSFKKVDESKVKHVPSQTTNLPTHCNGNVSKHSELKPLEFQVKNTNQSCNSIPSIKNPVLLDNEKKGIYCKQTHNIEGKTKMMKEVDSPKVSTFTIMESVEDAIVSKPFITPKDRFFRNFNYTLKNSNEGNYKVENVKNKNVNYVCVEKKKAFDFGNEKETKWVAKTTVLPALIENIKLNCVNNIYKETKKSVMESGSKSKIINHISKENQKSAKKNSLNELKVEQKERRSSRSSCRSLEKRRSEKGAVSEQRSATSSVLMWRELEDELKKLNEMVEEEEKLEKQKERKRKESRDETRKQSLTHSIPKTATKDAQHSKERDTLSYRKSFRLNSIDFIDSEVESVSIRSSVRTANSFSEEEEMRRNIRKMQKQSPISNDSSFLLQKPPHPRSHSAKVVQLSAHNDSLERKMRSQKYLENAIHEVSDKDTKKRWKINDSDGESTASLFCGGGMDLLKELKKMELLKKTPLKAMKKKKKEMGRRMLASYDSDSCSSRISKGSSTIKSIDMALDQYLRRQSADKDFDYGKYMLCAGKDLPREKEFASFAWYQKNASKSEAIEYLRHKPVGSFLIRDSNSFPGAYGLVLKIETPTDPSHNITETKSIRNFLIESTKEAGVRVKGSPLEPVFPDLESLVNKHSHKRMSLPCKLLLPIVEIPAPEVLKRRHFSVSSSPGLSCSVLYLSSENVEALAENTAICRATQCLLERSGRRQGKGTTVCDLHVSKEGLVLTDTCRTLFFRRHYSLESITFAAIHEEDAKWPWTDQSFKKTLSRIFGILCRSSENQYNHVCHLFAELDFPASEVVSKINQLLENMDL